MRKYFGLSVFLAFISFSLSCNSDMSSNLQSKAIALGKMNEIVVVADQLVWDGVVGDSARHYLQSPYPLMPTPEAMFDLRHFTSEELRNEVLRRQLRTYVILANLSDDDSPTTQLVRRDLGEDKFHRAMNEGNPTTSLGRNKWAQGQLLIYLFAKNDDELCKVIKKSFPAIAENVNKHDSKQLESKTYPRGVNKGLTEEMKLDYGIDIRIPFDFKLAKEVKKDKLRWFRKDDKESIMNLVIQSVPYTGPDQFDTKKLVALSNDFGKTYVESSTEGSYLRLNDKALPILDYIHNIDDMYTKEIRGVWEMTEDFMGGPFVGYLIHQKDRNELIFIGSFVYAPGQEKRDMVQQLDYIVKSANSI